MAKKGRTYKVEIDVTGAKPVPKIKGMKPEDPLVFNKDVDKMKKVDHYRIRFELDNPNKTDLRFIQDVDNVMWCHGVKSCPTGAGTLPGVLWVDAVDSDGTGVELINMDLVKQDFGFLLNLADKNIPNPTPADYVALDPIGENQDRGSLGSDRIMANMVVTIGVGLAAGLVAFAAAETFLPAW